MYSEHDILIILAGGASSRMKGATKTKGLRPKDIVQANTRSKGLLEVGADNLPFLHYLLYNAKKAGYKRIFIVIGETDTFYQEIYGKHIKNNHFHGLDISFARQHIPKGGTKPIGTADAVYQTLVQYPELQNRSFTVCNSDNLYSSEVLRALRDSTALNALIGYDSEELQYTTERIARFALIKLNKSNHLIDIIEKPDSSVLENYRDIGGKLRVSMNIFKFNGQQFFPYLKNCPLHPKRNEKELPTALLNMVQAFPNSVAVIPFSEHVIDLTSKDDILQVRRFLKKAYPHGLDW
ncbi:MAG: NTP transferase domain-containing protein [Croceitalea sp.]|nr:NTP transferase domain-containing protein [Croceitalea sp.]